MKMKTTLLASLTIALASQAQTLKMYQKGSLGLQYFDVSKIDSMVFLEKQNQTISFAKLNDHLMPDQNIALSASSNSGLPIIFLSTTPSTCSISSNQTITLLNSGVCTVSATQAGDWDWLPGTNSQSFNISKSNQSISFQQIQDQYTDANLAALSATATSGLPISYSSQTPSVCSLSGDYLVLNDAGTCTITASQSGSNYYNPAMSISQSFVLSKHNQTINFSTISNQDLGATLTLSASATSSMPISYTSQTPSTCSVSGSTLTTLNSGICTVTASQTGSQAYNPASSVTQSFNISDRYPSCMTANSNLLSSCPWSGNTDISSSYIATSSGDQLSGNNFSIPYSTSSNSISITGYAARTSSYYSIGITNKILDGNNKTVTITYNSDQDVRMQLNQADWPTNSYCLGAGYKYILPSTSGATQTLTIPLSSFSSLPTWAASCTAQRDLSKLKGFSFTNNTAGPITTNLSIYNLRIQ